MTKKKLSSLADEECTQIPVTYVDRVNQGPRPRAWSEMVGTVLQDIATYDRLTS
jgi:hypothetical protein